MNREKSRRFELRNADRRRKKWRRKKVIFKNYCMEKLCDVYNCHALFSADAIWPDFFISNADSFKCVDLACVLCEHTNCQQQVPLFSPRLLLRALHPVWTEPNSFECRPKPRTGHKPWNLNFNPLVQDRTSNFRPRSRLAKILDLLLQISRNTKSSFLLFCFAAVGPIPTGRNAQCDASKWDLLMWMGVSTLDASNIKEKMFQFAHASRPAPCVDWAVVFPITNFPLFL